MAEWRSHDMFLYVLNEAGPHISSIVQLIVLTCLDLVHG